jgi:hypothetical protein
LKLAFYDVESLPNTCYTWGLHNQFIAPSQIKSPQRIMSWALKYSDGKKMHYADERKGHREMIEHLYELLSEADAVCHYNGQSFDNKMLNTELVKYALAPLPPAKQIDLLKVVKKNFRLPSNKLEYVAPALGCGQKIKHAGFDLWVRCMAGENKAFRELKEYNCQDVLLLEELYAKLLPWIGSHPSFSLESGKPVCTNCGSDKTQHRGYHTTKTGKYRRLQCTACGHWQRSRIAEPTEKDILVSL